MAAQEHGYRFGPSSTRAFTRVALAVHNTRVEEDAHEYCCDAAKTIVVRDGHCGHAYCARRRAYTGTLITAVYQDATGRLEFDYQFINNGPDDVRSLTGFNFSVFSTDVGYRDAAYGSFVTPSIGTTPPIFADRDGDGSTVGFEFGTGLSAINAGETSLILVIKTDAPEFMAGVASVIDGAAQTVDAFQPTGTPIGPAADVPEPATLLLVGSAVIGMGVTVRRRSQR